MVAVTAVNAEAVRRVDRRGVCNLGGGFQYGLIEGESRYGLDFQEGPGYSLHVRYNLTRHTALVVYFDSQRYDAVVDSLDEAKIVTAHVGFRFFRIPAGDVLRFVEFSAGFYRPEIVRPRTQEQSIGEDICFPGEGFLAHAGAGIEVFFTQAWTVELGLHGYGLTGKGLCRGEQLQGEKNFSFSGQIGLGINYYLLR
jgi:hypothetical protein